MVQCIHWCEKNPLSDANRGIPIGCMLDVLPTFLKNLNSIAVPRICTALALCCCTMSKCGLAKFATQEETNKNVQR